MNVRLTVPNTLKNADGILSPSRTVLEAYTPNGKVNPHHPILKGKFLALAMDATAKKSQASPKLQRIRDTMNPKAYKTGPAMG